MSLKVLLITLAVLIPLSSAGSFNVKAKEEDRLHNNDVYGVTLKHEDAENFYRTGLQKRTTVHEECYVECCSWEEVDEVYGNTAEGQNYWCTYVAWKQETGACPSSA